LIGTRLSHYQILQKIGEGGIAIPELSPDGRHVLFAAVGQGGFRVNVLDLATGEQPLHIELPRVSWHANILIGRARWMPDGHGIAIVGQDQAGRTGIFVQDFVPGQTTRAPARPLADFSHTFASESFGISPDGRRIVISALFERTSLKVVEQVPLRAWK